MSNNSIICPNCQEQNNPAFVVCWKCSYSFTSVACPFCEAKISRTAKKCQFCGEWIDASGVTAERKTVEKSEPRQRKAFEKEPIREIVIESKPWHSNLSIFLGHILVISILLGGGWLIFKSAVTPQQYSSYISEISTTVNKIKNSQFWAKFQ